MKCDTTVQPEVTLPQIRYSMGSHMKVSDIIIENVRFIGICSSSPFFASIEIYEGKKKKAMSSLWTNQLTGIN